MISFIPIPILKTLLIFQLFFSSHIASTNSIPHEKFVHQLVRTYFGSMEMVPSLQKLKKDLDPILNERDISPFQDLSRNVQAQKESAKAGLQDFEDPARVAYQRALIITHVAKARSSLSRLKSVLLSRDVTDDVKKELSVVSNKLQELKDELE